MRQLKFRAWDGEKMISPDYISRDGLAYWYENSVIETSDKVMQFTGLKDKNSKEIYEGDIVNTEDSGLARPEDVLAVKYSGGAFVIYNPNCCEICKKGSGCISNLDEWRVDKYIVIGNIYENPELIK